MSVLRRASLSICLSLALAGSAQAYVRTRPPGSKRAARWQKPELTLQVDTTQLPKGMSAERFISVAKASAATWSAAAVDCTAVNLRVEHSARPLQGGERDHVNSVVFQTMRWCRGGHNRTGNCYPARATAYTTVHFDEAAAQTADAPIEEADIELNAVNLAWSGHGDRTADLRWVLTHEIGHVLGFDHSCRSSGSARRLRDHHGRPIPVCDGSFLQAIMSPTSGAMMPSAQGLDDDARRAVCDVYPASGSKYASTDRAATLIAAAVGIAAFGLVARFFGKRRANDVTSGRTR